MNLLHHAVRVDAASEVGSPMYAITSEHAVALAAAALVPLAALWVRRRARRGVPWASSMVVRYRVLASADRFVAWLLAISSAIHLGLVVGHEPSFLSILFVLDAAALLAVAWLMLVGRRWRLPAAVALAGSVLAYAAASFGGSAPDQVGLATKLVELAALAVVLTPRSRRRLARLGGSAAIVVLVLVTGISAWAGAFTATGGDGDHGAAPPPGTIVRTGSERAPTPEELAAADRFYAEAVAGLARYADPDVAAVDGYQTEGIVGTDFHAANPAFAADGRVFDPPRPETLVFAATASGPVLLGAVYEMPSVGEMGPAIGGPHTMWHAHENVCISLTPPALTGLQSPFGLCPVGSITIPVTPEMIHVWVAPGAPQRFGDLDPAWLAAYLETFEG